MQKTKKKKGFLDGYKTYDPIKDGYGTREQWKYKFRDRMGLDEANQILGDDDPHTLLELTPGKYTKRDLKKAYLRAAKKWHPDITNDEKMFVKIQAAFWKLDARM